MKKYLGSHKVARGETMLSIAKKYYGDESAGKYISQANGNISKARPGSVLKLPRVTAVGEQGFEFVFDVGGEQVVAPNPEAQRMVQGGFKPARGLAMGGYLGDDPYGGIDPTAPAKPAPTTTTTTKPTIPYNDDPYGGVDVFQGSNPYAPGTVNTPSGTYLNGVLAPPTQPTTPAPSTFQQQAPPPPSYVDMMAGQAVQSFGPTPEGLKSQFAEQIQIARQQQAHPSYQNALGTMQWDTGTNQYILQDGAPELAYTPTGVEKRKGPEWDALREQQMREFEDADKLAYDAYKLRQGEFPEGFTDYHTLSAEQAMGIYGYGDFSAAGGLKQYANVYIGLLNDFEAGGEPLMHIPNNVVGHPDFPYSVIDLLEAGYAPDPNGGAFWGYSLVGGSGPPGSGGFGYGGGTAGGNRRPGGGGGTGPTYDPRLGLLVNWRGVGFG